MLETLKLSFLDKIGGGVLGTFKHVLIILVVLNFMFPIFAKMPFWQKSALAPELLQYETKESMGDSLQTLNKNIDDNIKENSHENDVK